MSADTGPPERAPDPAAVPEATAEPDADGGPVTYQVDAAWARGVLIGDGAVQVNNFYQGTWTDGVTPEPLIATSGEVESPYRGLESFQEADAGFFFGRDTAVTDLLGRLAGCRTGTGLMVVSGVSGAGKSSLLQAGVLPRLRRGGLPGDPGAARWPCVVVIPGGDPLGQLALGVAPVARLDAAAVRQSLAANPADFALTAGQAASAAGAATEAAPEGGSAAGSTAAGGGPGAGRRLLLIVDQFETVFTQCERDADRRALMTALRSAADAGAALVVVVIRATWRPGSPTTRSPTRCRTATCSAR